MHKLLVAIALVALTGTACSSKDSSTVATPPPSSPSAAPAATAATFSGMSFSFTLKADNEDAKFYFEPATINVQHGSTATVTVSNVGNIKHNLTIKSLNIDKDVEAGKSVSVTLHLPATAGTVPFYCEYHRSSGMTGNFIVK